jgi:biotin synthase
MCYAIPGKIEEIEDRVVTVDYFGEKRKARNDFYELCVGDYVLAQGGFVIQKVSSEEARSILETWQELFFKLKDVDLRLAQKPKDLRQIANALRHKHCDNACCIHGILEFSNYCTQDCLYCGLRRENRGVERYRMTPEEIIEAAIYAVRELRFKALVLQSGEDLWYDDGKLVHIVREILRRSPALLIVSIGERAPALYEKLYREGARGALLRFETGNERLYDRLRPGKQLRDRIGLITQLRRMGYLIMTGFLIGLPGQTEQDILNDVELTSSLGAEMFSCGPFIPHPQTPLAGASQPSRDMALDTIARIRIMNPDSRILVTTAFESINEEQGLRDGLLAGGNSMMVNVTPARYHPLYSIYPHRAGTQTDVKQRIQALIELLYSIGRAPVDIGITDS